MKFKNILLLFYNQLIIILLVIKIRFDDIEQRYNTIKRLKQERDYNTLKPNENKQKTSFKNQDMDYE